nr:DoxX family membrane protein [Halosimplex carlsbadense]
MRTTLLARSKRPLRYVMGLSYVLAGVLHFVAPETYERIVPPQFPRPRTLVYLSGIAEAGLGIGVLFERTRRRSAWGLIALLVAVFPANVYMATGDDFDLGDVPAQLRDPRDAALWARLPLQAVLVAWAWWYTDESSGRE